MKIYAYILIVLSGVLTAQCSKVTLDEICGSLMLSASTTADELSQAITARGIDNPRPKTCAVSMRFHIQDYVLCFVAIVLVIIAFVLL